MKYFMSLVIITLLMQLAPNQFAAAENKDQSPKSTAWWNNEIYTERQHHRIPALTFKAPKDVTVTALIRNYRASSDNNIIRDKVSRREFELSVVLLPSFQHNHPPFADHVYIKKADVDKEGFMLVIEGDGSLRRWVSDEEYIGLVGRHVLIVQFEQKPVDEEYFLVRMLTAPVITMKELSDKELATLTDGESYFDRDTMTLHLNRKKLKAKTEVEYGLYRRIGDEDEFLNIAELEKLGMVLRFANNYPNCDYCIVKAGDPGSPPIENGWLRSSYPWNGLIISNK